MENADSSQVQVSKFQVSETQVSQVQVRNHAYFHCLSGYTWNPDANICEGLKLNFNFFLFIYIFSDLDLASISKSVVFYLGL